MNSPAKDRAIGVRTSDHSSELSDVVCRDRRYIQRHIEQEGEVKQGGAARRSIPVRRALLGLYRMNMLSRSRTVQTLHCLVHTC